MIVVMTTTSTAAVENLMMMMQTVRTQLAKPVPDGALVTNNVLSGILTVFMLACAYTIVIAAVRRVWPTLAGDQRGFAVAVGARG